MKSADIRIGGRYLTRVGGELVPVIVTRGTDIRQYGRFGSPDRFAAAFVVRRADGRELPKPRRAVSLRLTKGQAIAEAIEAWGAAIAARGAS